MGKGDVCRANRPDSKPAICDAAEERTLRSEANSPIFASNSEANMFIWELPDWPRFRWDANTLAQPLATVHLKQGRLLGRLERLGFALQVEAELQATTEEAVKNAEIEGEILNRESVRSSVARRLGMPDAALGPVDRRADGIVEMTLDATRNCMAPLTRERLFAWQAALFPTGRSGLHEIRIGTWRDDARGPMQVVSGPIGREKVHYQAPPVERIEAEMQAFIGWFNEPPVIDGVLHAATAHLWFVTIHPFEDGNGRIARVLADMSFCSLGKFSTAVLQPLKSDPS